MNQRRHPKQDFIPPEVQDWLYRNIAFGIVGKIVYWLISKLVEWIK